MSPTRRTFSGNLLAAADDDSIFSLGHFTVVANNHAQAEQAIIDAHWDESLRETGHGPRVANLHPTPGTLPDVYMPQFFDDVIEIRRNMTGLTGTGELIYSFNPLPALRENASEREVQAQQSMVTEIEALVDALNLAASYEQFRVRQS